MYVPMEVTYSFFLGFALLIFLLVKLGDRKNPPKKH